MKTKRAPVLWSSIFSFVNYSTEMVVHLYQEVHRVIITKVLFTLAKK